ncbi:MAG: DUF1223 domain-containing protein [Alphaproteobacteria bacterium]
MLQNIFLFQIACFTLFFSANTLYAQLHTKIPKAKAPVVVELFTSQGCSSCPPADRVLEKLAEQETVIALSCHVTYWDYLQWKDRLGNEMCDIRQHGYASLKGSNQIYTPQMIVNGLHEFVGSKSAELNTAIIKANRNPIQNIAISYTDDAQKASFELPEIKNGEYRLWGFGYKKAVQQSIRGGENSGRSVTYTNPVTSFINLGSWDGMAKKHVFEINGDEMDGIAILAQKNGYGQIIAAGKLEF